MKRITVLMSTIICLSITSASCGQEENDLPQAASAAVSSSEVPLVCTLTGPEFAERMGALKQEVFSKMLAVDEVEDGFVFSFPDEDQFLLTLTDYMMAERRCCAFLQFDLSAKANAGGLSLKVSGAPEVKEILRVMIEEVKG